DGIRDYKVTGVQTCALPISPWSDCFEAEEPQTLCSFHFRASFAQPAEPPLQIPALPALPGCAERRSAHWPLNRPPAPGLFLQAEIGRASCRERVSSAVGAGS